MLHRLWEEKYIQYRDATSLPKHNITLQYKKEGADNFGSFSIAIGMKNMIVYRIIIQKTAILSMFAP